MPSRMGYRETINSGGTRTIKPRKKVAKRQRLAAPKSAAKSAKPRKPAAKRQDPASSAVTMPESSNTGAAPAVAELVEG